MAPDDQDVSRKERASHTRHHETEHAVFVPTFVKRSESLPEQALSRWREDYGDPIVKELART